MTDNNHFSAYCEANGFRMTFPNGITISVRWAEFNYCDQGYRTAETAAWVNGSKMNFVHIQDFDYGGDDVLSRMTSNDVARFIYNASLGLTQNKKDVEYGNGEQDQVSVPQGSD